jgi:hypothetical protein
MHHPVLARVDLNVFPSTAGVTPAFHRGSEGVPGKAYSPASRVSVVMGSNDDPTGASGEQGSATPDSGDSTAAGGTDADPVAVGVELLARAEDAELSLADAMDRVEAVSTAPSVVREILDTAEMRGVIDREDGVVRVRGSGYVSQTSDVVSRDGDYSCRRCGTGLSTGYFIELDAGELGPFGSECVQKVTGRDD